MYRVYYRTANRWVRHEMTGGTRIEALKRAGKLSLRYGLALVTLENEDVVIAFFDNGNELRVGVPLWK